MVTIKEWFHHLFNPHCPECNEPKICPTCEVLKQSLELERTFNKVLFEKLTGKETTPTLTSVEPLLKPRHIPWRVQKQMLEQEDRRAAQVLKQREEEIARDISAPSGGVKFAPPDDPDVIALEREMDIVAKEREDASKIS